MAAITFHTALNATVSRWMRRAAMEAGRTPPERFKDAQTSSRNIQMTTMQLDPDVVSAAIPAFFIGQDRDGFWIAREAKGRIGGLFLLKSSAVAFARAEGGASGCATIFPAESFELDLVNQGNPFAEQLAPLVRRATNLSKRIGAFFEKLTRRSADFRGS
jgi:hypothetical protein